MEIAQNTTIKLSKVEKSLRKNCCRLLHEHNHSWTEQTSDLCSIERRHRMKIEEEQYVFQDHLFISLFNRTGAKNLTNWPHVH